MSEKVTKRQFSVAPAFVMHLIKSQAGSLAKAVQEAVQNSVDAGATQVEIEADETSLRIIDNGRGFRSLEEIESWFEVFGFDHTGLDRRWGNFGVGRGQLWAFASTAWRTNTFEMMVDVRKSGLDYDLVQHAEAAPGMVISATLYEKLRTSELLTFQRELAELCEFTDVPVVVNGKRISTDPGTIKWTHETEEAWIMLSEKAMGLKVYNMGVLVRSYPSYQFGVGGVVVTKKRLELNTARNDILQASCAVFKKIKPYLQSKADERAKKSVRLTESQMANLALRFLAGELDYEEVSSTKLISDMRGKRTTIRKFLESARATLDKTVTVIRDGERSPVAERCHRNGNCFVLSDTTLGRFGVDSVKELMKGIGEAIEQSQIRRYGRQYGMGWEEGVTCVEDWREACKSLCDGYEEIPKDEWTPLEQACIEALQAADPYVRGAIRGAGCVEAEEASLSKRALLLGVSERADAWTNGKDRTWINRSVLSRMKSGIGGALSLVGVLTHEYLHGSASTDTHAHDLTFYERMERVMLFEGNEGSGSQTIGEAVEVAMREFAKQCARLEVRSSKATMRSLDRLEEAGGKVARANDRLAA